MPSSYCFVLDFNFCRPCVIVCELVVLLLQACLSVAIVFLACNPSQSCYIKLCPYFCPFYFLLRLLCQVVCAFICLVCLFIYIYTLPLCACFINSAGTSLFCLSYSNRIALRRLGEDCRISNRFFTPLSGHLRVLFVTYVVNQDISLPSVGNVLLLVSLPLLSRVSRGLPVLQHSFVVSSYAIKFFFSFRRIVPCLSLSVCLFVCYLRVTPVYLFFSFQSPLFLIFYFIYFILSIFLRSRFRLPSGGIL